MITWDDLRHLEALERLGSATAAGRELGVAASTVYRRIAALEQAVGFACLVRGRGITESGRELSMLARTTGAAITGIAGRARARREEVHGVVTLTTTDGFTPLLVPGLSQLAATYPRLRVDVRVDERISVRRREADVSLTLVDKRPGILIAKKMFPVRFAVYATRELAADPTGARWVTLSHALAETWLGRWEREHVPRERIVASTASRRHFIDLVAAGVGIGLCPVPLAADVPSLVEVRAFADGTAALARSAWLLTHPDVQQEGRVRAVVRVLSAHLRKPS